MKKIEKLKVILGHEKKFYLLTAVYGLFLGLLTLALPISIQTLINTVSVGGLYKQIVVICLFLFCILAFSACLKMAQHIILEYFQRHFFARMTANMASKLVVLDSGNQQSKEKENLAHRFFEIMTVQKSVVMLMMGGLEVVLQLAVGLTLLAFYHPYFLVFNIFLIIVIYLAWRLYGPSALNTAVEESKSKYKVVQWLDEMSTTDSASAFNETEKRIQEYTNKRKKHFYYLMSQSIIFVSVYALMSALVLGLGGYLVNIGQLSLGQLVASELIISLVLASLAKSGKYLETFYDLFASVDKLFIFENIKEADEKYFPSKNQYTVPGWSRVLGYILLILIAAFILAISFVPWRQTSSGQGRILALDPNDRPQQIHALVGGRINKWYVRDGSRVKEGDPLVEIVDTDPNYLMRLKIERDSAIKKFQAAKIGTETGLSDYNRQRELYEQGLSAQVKFEKAKMLYQKLLVEEAQSAANLAKTEVKFARQQTQLITAPSNGTVLRVVSGDQSVLVKEGDVVASFVPDTAKLAVELYLTSHDMPFVREGREVRLQFEGWPAIQFSGWPSMSVGTYLGKVDFVEPSVTLDGKFRLVVVPVEGNDWPDQVYLKQGSRVLGWVLLDEVKLGFELWRQLNSFPPYMALPENELLMKKKKSSGSQSKKEEESEDEKKSFLIDKFEEEK